MADFIAEFQPNANSRIIDQSDGDKKLEVGGKWNLYIDGSSNQKGAGVSLILESSEGCILEKAIRLGFEASNNEAE